MLVEQGDARTTQVNQSLAGILAAVAGALNASAFQAVGFFSANMTGNVSLLSGHIANGHVLSGLFFLFILLAFIGGSGISTLIINAGTRRRVRYIYAVNILAEAVLLAGLGVLMLLLQDGVKVKVLILGLSFLMGLQNAVVTRISNARIRTTHISGIATDIGIELAHLFDITRGNESIDHAGENRSKLSLHMTTILSFLGGGVVGVLVYEAAGDFILFAVSGVLLALSFRSIKRAIKQGESHMRP